MKHLKSLREYIEALRALGELQEIDVEVDSNLEMGAIIRRSYELRAPAPLFNRISGIERGFRVLGAPAGVSGQEGLFLARVALSLGLPPATHALDIVEALVEAHGKPALSPRRVPSGPCKENKLVGPAVDLGRLPAPLIHDGDGGRYLNTWGTIIVRTPDRGWTNWSITRIMVTGKNTMAGGVIPTQHLGIIYRQWQALGQAMPFALAIGTEPAIPFVSGMPLDEGVNEADFLGGYLGESLEVVDCETVDLQVPATAEIVIEGHLTHQSTREGPMGEYSGYLMAGGGMPSPVFQVSALTYRNDPILPVVAAGEPIEENHTCWGLGISAQLLWDLRQQGFPVQTCFIPFQSAAHWVVVTVRRAAVRAEGAEKLARNLAGLVFGSRLGCYLPKVLLMDDDIDPTNLEEVVWAFATRCHPRGEFLFPDEKMLPLVAFLTPEERAAARGTKVIYNCLLPENAAVRRSSFRYAWPAEIQEQVVRNWQRYGFGSEDA
jgi:4-hydroxy-3-polyprenylbenzoate decarboxylase